jgi:nitrate reductase gamma subunit
LESLLEFARGPLFRLTFAVMILGLLRLFLLDLWGMFEAYRKAGDKNMPWGLAFRKTISWLLPFKKVPNSRPVYSLASILFHIGLIIVPVFLYAHVHLWKGALGFGWFALSQKVADILTLTTIAFGLLLFIGRVGSKNASFISRRQDYFWPLILLVPFVTGYICSNLAVNPETYQAFMLAHILAGELIFVLIPFTKIAHIILMPLSQFVSTIAWRFPPETDDAVCTTLGKKGARV